MLELSVENQVEGRKRADIGQLRQQLRILERAGGQARPAYPLGLPAVDRALGGGLATGCLHEVIGAAGDGAATGFVAALAAGVAAQVANNGRGAILWCLPRPDLYGPGLAAAGLDPARLILATVERAADGLWAMEEGARCGALAAVVGEVDRLSLTAARRLQLASETGGVTAFLLRTGVPADGAAAVASTRWRVAAAPGGEGIGGGSQPWLDGPCWQAELLRCRGGRPGTWTLSWQEGAWRHAAGDLAMAAPVCDGPAAAKAGA
jgi:protein ImuA